MASIPFFALIPSNHLQGDDKAIYLASAQYGVDKWWKRHYEAVGKRVKKTRRMEYP